MLEIIGIIVVSIIGWAITKMVIYRIFPEYGLKVAERRYRESPDNVNEKLLWDARNRASKRRNQ